MAAGVAPPGAARRAARRRRPLSQSVHARLGSAAVVPRSIVVAERWCLRRADLPPGAPDAGLHRSLARAGAVGVADLRNLAGPRPLLQRRLHRLAGGERMGDVVVLAAVA